MPALRNVDPSIRRSRRLSRQEPRQYDDEGFEVLDPTYQFQTQLRHPSPDSSVTPSVSQTRSPTPYSPSPVPPRRPKKGRPSQTSNASSSSAPEHIGRPSNPYILYRSWVWATQRDTIGETDHREISKITGAMWKALPEEEKEPFRRQAQLVKEEHMKKYPDYKFTPQLRTSAKKRREKKALKGKARASGTALMIGQHGGNSGKDMYGTDGVVTESEITPRAAPLKMEELEHSLSQPYSFFIDEAAFTPTEDIPPLDLNAALPPNRNEFNLPTSTPNTEENPQAFSLSGSLVPPSYLHIAPPFGSRPEMVPHQNDHTQYEQPGLQSANVFNEAQASVLFSNPATIPTCSTAFSYDYGLNVASSSTSQSLPHLFIDTPKSWTGEDGLHYFYDETALFESQGEGNYDSVAAAPGASGSSTSYESWNLNPGLPDAMHLEEGDYQFESLDTLFSRYLNVPDEA